MDNKKPLTAKGFREKHQREEDFIEAQECERLMESYHKAKMQELKGEIEKEWKHSHLIDKETLLKLIEK